MRILRSTQAVGQDRGASAAIGNFDGVHLGHQAVISQAKMADVPLGVVTFEPHPRQYFAPDAPPFRLMTPDARATRLKQMGVDIVFELPFDQIAPLSAEDFARDVIVEGLGLRHVTVGRDFGFGKGRDGNAETLTELGHRLGFGVTIAELVEQDGEVSSTRIRQALSDGNPQEAARMLGHLHRIEGPVLHGDKRGRELGYPTANLALDGLHLPRFGIYAARVEVLTGPHKGSYDGVASLGVRPMFDGGAPKLEVHIFDLASELYDERLSVGLVEFLREEERFADRPALIAQMNSDSARAREILAR